MVPGASTSPESTVTLLPAVYEQVPLGGGVSALQNTVVAPVVPLEPPLDPDPDPPLLAVVPVDAELPLLAVLPLDALVEPALVLAPVVEDAPVEPELDALEPLDAPLLAPPELDALALAPLALPVVVPLAPEPEVLPCEPLPPLLEECVPVAVAVLGRPVVVGGGEFPLQADNARPTPAVSRTPNRRMQASFERSGIFVGPGRGGQGGLPLGCWRMARVGADELPLESGDQRPASGA